MVKKSVLLMSVFAFGLTLASEAEAVKQKNQVAEGPMDKFVRKAPRATTTPQQPQNFKASNPQKTILIPRTDPATMRYILAQLGYSQGLTSMQKAWLLK